MFTCNNYGKIMKKKVLFITPGLYQGGLEHSLIMMLRLLDQSKYDLYLYTYRKDLSLLPLVPQYVKVYNDLLNQHYYRKPKAILYQLLHKITHQEKYQEKLKQYIHYQKVTQPQKHYSDTCFDAVIANSIGKTSEMAAYVNAKKRYAFFHSSVDLHHDTNAKLFPKYDGIIAVSQGVKDMLCNSYDGIENKVYVLENYVDASEIIEKADEPLNTSIPDKKLILSTCGRFSEEKGFDLAVESAKELKDKGIDFVWLFVGDGVLREKLEESLDKYGLQDNILITGYVENPFPYIKCCDIYVQPSYHESYGRTIKEAIILGKPIVSTDTVGGNTLLENGMYGEIVPISAEEITNGIMSAIKKNQQGIYRKYDINDNQKEKETYINGLESIIDS